MRCLRCDLAAPFGAKACVACSSVAFYWGDKPAWPVRFGDGDAIRFLFPSSLPVAPRLVVPADGSCLKPSASRRPARAR